MKKSRLDYLNPDKTPKEFRRKMTNEEFFYDLIKDDKLNVRLHGEYVEYAESLSLKGSVIVIDATDKNINLENKLIEYFNDAENVNPLAILIYNICHIEQSQQHLQFSSLLKREISIVPDGVPILIIEDLEGDYLLAREIIQNSTLLGVSKSYIFVSHSHKDIIKVRKIRNYLEEHNFEPILFYLRCMDNDDLDANNLRELIYKEIDARKWFLYLDSKNSRASSWVQDEIRYIEKKHNHIIKKICIDNLTEDQIIQSIDDLMYKLTIYISCSYSELKLAEMFYEQFSKHDIRTYFDVNDISTGTELDKQITYMEEIKSKNGGIVLLLTEENINSEYIQREIMFAKHLNVRIYPISFDEDVNNQIKNSPYLSSFISKFLWFQCQPNTISIYKCVNLIIHDIQNSLSE